MPLPRDNPTLPPVRIPAQMSGSIPLRPCSTCKSASANSRNLVIFIDGTSNQPGPMATNVKKLYDVISESVKDDLKFEQRKLYLEGIGAYGPDHLPLPRRTGKVIYSILETAFAWNVEKNIMDAYEWLAGTYREGDQIYLFGFSRGAYQVRALAGIIHEVGLVKEKTKRRIEQAYHRYLAIDPNHPKTKDLAMHFKKDFCFPGVRIHFMGVWDTVSSLGLIKRDVHITSSTSATHACHFRHALALDECRVKFLPEYFLEVNPTPSHPHSDVKEVWFAGYHSDVGGTSRPHAEGVAYPVHAGNVPLLWMTQEAADRGLVFDSEGFSWWPEDVDLGRKDSMKWYWKIFEVLRIRHQVSFGGIGKHERRRHRSRPRVVIPKQIIHFSALPGDVYTPRASLACDVDIPMSSQKASGESWQAGLCGEEPAATTLLTSLLSSPEKALKSLGAVLLLLTNFRLEDEQSQTIPRTQWSETSVSEHPGSACDKFALAVIYVATSTIPISEKLVQDARSFLETILRSVNHLDFPRALYILRFSARHQSLRRRFVDLEVIDALMVALDRITKSRNTGLYPFVMDSLRHLINDDKQRGNVVNRLIDVVSTKGRTRLSLTLEVKAPIHLTASLKVITSLAQHQPSESALITLREGLKDRILKLAQKSKGPVGPAAVEALVALKVELPCDIHFSNVLGYLCNNLPLLDAEGGNTLVMDAAEDSPRVFKVNDSENSGRLDDEDLAMDNLVRAIEWGDIHQRTAATLTLLKLCRYSMARDFCSRKRVLDVFVKQLKRKETSLLAAYALAACLPKPGEPDMWAPVDSPRPEQPVVDPPRTEQPVIDFPRAAQLVVDMLDKGWFDDAIGRIEGSKIFGDLMASDELRQLVIKPYTMDTLTKKLGNGDPHETRMSLICLDVLWKKDAAELARIVKDLVNANLKLLMDKDKGIRTKKRGVKVLSALALTEVGEQAIKPYVIGIVKMLLPSEGLSPSRSQLFSASAVVYNLCRNEFLRKIIQDSKEFADFERRRLDNIFYPQSR